MVLGSLSKEIPKIFTEGRLKDVVQKLDADDALTKTILNHITQGNFSDAIALIPNKAIRQFLNNQLKKPEVTNLIASLKSDRDLGKLLQALVNLSDEDKQALKALINEASTNPKKS